MNNFSAKHRSSVQDDVSLQRLIILGWIVILLNFPSGLLHHFLGGLVYLRELLFAIHLFLSLFWMAKRGQLGWLIQHSWVILIVPIMLLPAVMTPEFRLEALRTCKWSVYWIDWIILGHFLCLNKKWGSWLKWLLVLTAIELLLELVAGAVEWRTGDYLFKTEWGERTNLGVLTGNDQVLDNQIRIRGLQRDVFSFANIMAMSAVAGFLLTTLSKNAKHLAISLLWALAFSTMVFISGGRSAIFGVAGAATYAFICLINPAASRKYAVHFIILCTLIAFILSLVGVGHFTDFISDTLLSSSHVGDSTSAHMRDEFWKKMRGDFVQSPLILFLGGPIASMIDGKVEVMFHWADNQFLWNLYHTGIAGFAGVLLFFYKVIAPMPTQRDWMARRGLIMFLTFVIGEGIARESMTFIGCLPLFLFCGYYSASQWKKLNDTESTNHLQSMQQTILRRRRSIQ